MNRRTINFMKEGTHMKKTARRILSIVLATAMMLGLSITASAASSVSVEVGDSTTVNAPFGNAYDFQWVSGDDSVAYVTPIGDGSQAKITGASAGSTTITVYATAAGDEDNTEFLTEYISVTVTEPSRPVTVTMSRGSIDIGVGGTAQLYAEAENYIGMIQWTSSNPSVAYVDDYGEVTALSAGTTYITARAGDAYAECVVTVTAPEPDPLDVSIYAPQDVMEEGGSLTLTANASGGTGRYSYTWYNEDPDLVTVRGSGSTATVSAQGGGTTVRITVLVTDSNGAEETASCSIKVNSKARPTSANYNASGAASVGTPLAINPIANAIANQFRSQLGESLTYGADVYLSNPYDSVGAFSSNGERISSGVYSYVMFESMAFEPYKAGTFSTSYTIQQGNLSISGQITISVTGGIGVSSATLEASGLEMAPYSNNYLSLIVNPSNANVNVSWSSNNSRIVSVSGSGKTGYITSYGPGTAIITATVTDSNGRSLSSSCTVYVNSSATYNPSLYVTLDSDYYGTDTSDNMAKQFRDVFGYNLNYNNAVIRFSGTGDSRYGVLRLSNGRAISANTNYTFNEWVNNIHFEPVAAGTFSVPYTLTYNGDSLTGTFSIYIRGASVTAKLNTTSLSLATYSYQDISLSVAPSNARYSVAWSTSNSKIATVTGNSYLGRVETKGVAGTATITAKITDANGITVNKQCTVTVTNSSTYNPSVSTYLGVNYTGTGTSDAMIKQFRNIYGVTLNTSSATIRFSSTGNNNVGVMRLKDGTAIKANTNYTMAQYIQMYTEPVSVGTFTLPYTLTYNNQSLTGDVSVGINPVELISTIELANTNAYVFTSAAANGAIGSSMLGSAITNAVGSSWSYIRFGTATGSNVGTLYRNSNRAPLGSNNVSLSDLGALYFVPAGTNGTYAVAFTVYNKNGGTLSTGTLYINVKGAAAPATTITFADIDPNNPNQQWVVEPVRWAVSKGITNGTGTNSAGQPLFEPNTTCNKGQILTFLWRAQGSPAPTISNPFTDVKSDRYCYNAALWAYEKGIISGTTLGETTPCTRAMAVTYMWILTGRPSMPAADFGDVPSGGETASAVAWAVSAGVTNGMGNDATGRPSFQPETTCTRGQIVTFLQRAYG